MHSRSLHDPVRPGCLKPHLFEQGRDLICQSFRQRSPIADVYVADDPLPVQYICHRYAANSVQPRGSPRTIAHDLHVLVPTLLYVRPIVRLTVANVDGEDDEI